FYPFPFMLEPLTLDSLAKYVYAESPPDFSEKYPDLADEIKKRVEKATTNPHQVSELFNLMISLIQDANYLPDEVFQADTYPFQAKWDEWGRGYKGGERGNATHANPKDAPDVLVTPLASRDDAVNSLTAIAQQGEACPTVNMDSPSHFARFLKIYMEMSSCAHEGWSPARNVAINPYVEPMTAEDPAEGTVSNEERDLITHPEARLWGHLFNLRYRMLLDYLTHSFELAGGLNQAGIWTPRGTIINATFGEMYNLRAIANIIVQIPLSAIGSPKVDGKTAGPPFSMPYTLNLPAGEPNRWRLHKDLLLAAQPLVAQLLQISPQSRHDYLFSIQEADKKLLEIINRILTGDINLALT
ncbi:MAG: ferritin-like domain-containing protein, partial [Acidobacteriota bacterium]